MTTTPAPNIALRAPKWPFSIAVTEPPMIVVIRNRLPTQLKYSAPPTSLIAVGIAVEARYQMTACRPTPRLTRASGAILARWRRRGGLSAGMASMAVMARKLVAAL